MRFETWKKILAGLIVFAMIALFYISLATASSGWNITGKDPTGTTVDHLVGPVIVQGMVIVASANAATVQLYDVEDNSSPSTSNFACPPVAVPASTTLDLNLYNMYISGNLYAGAIHDAGSFVYLK